MPVNFDTDLLRTFVAIVDAGGFTQAANEPTTASTSRTGASMPNWRNASER